MSRRPIPFSPPSLLSFSTRETASSSSPSTAVGTPFSKWIVTYVGSSGAFSGETPSSRKPSLLYCGSFAGFSRSRVFAEPIKR